MNEIFLPDSTGQAVWNTDALDQFLPQVYTELKRLAACHLKNEKPNHTLSPTAIVHEVYVLLRNQHSLRLKDRVHFLSLASSLMRRVLVNYAKYRKRKKRGEGVADFSLPEIEGITLVQFEERQIDVITLETALTELERKDKRKARIVELYFFGGMTFEEISDFLNISQRQVMRDWRFARTWLYQHLRGGKANE